MNPRVTDNDTGEISVALDGKELRGWSYANDDERRQKMLQAREYIEGWCDAQSMTPHHNKIERSSETSPIETPVPSYGAVQGILHAWFKEAKDPYFQIRELSTDALVKVMYPSALYPDVAKAVQERTTMLMVSGNMLFDRSTRLATELRADRIDPIKMLSTAEFEELFGSSPNFVPELDANETWANG